MTLLPALLLALLPTLPSAPLAVTPWAQGQSLDSLISKAIAANPEIRAAKAKIEMSDAQRIVRGSLPDPVLSFRYQESEVGISQMIPLPPKLSLETSIVFEDMNRAQAEFNSAVVNLTNEVKSTYFDLYYLEHAIQITQENHNLLRGFSGVLAARYASGLAPQADLLKLNVEISKFEEREINLEQSKFAALTRLALLLGLPSDTSFEVALEPGDIQLKMTLEELRRKARERSPELLAAAAETRREEKALELARWQYMPDAELGFSYMIKNKMPNAMAGITLPLWWWKQNAMVREASASRRMAQASYQANLNQTDYMLTSLYSSIEKNTRLIALYHTTIIPQANGAYETSLAGYQSGKVDFMTLMDNLTTIYIYQDEYYSKRAEYFKDLAELEALIGERIF